jgi:CheY-like chemotaxis protein
MTKSIVMIEDNPNNAMLVRRMLEPTQFELQHAWDGESGLQLVMEQQPDLILLDLGLPDVDGQTLASFIRRIPELANVPMIAITAWPEETAREMVRAYGCDGYIPKPIDTRTFVAKIMAYFQDEAADVPPPEA